MRVGYFFEISEKSRNLESDEYLFRALFIIR